jgi:deazaflavin-dependent oxidoreductase (nitroreductase family)
MAVELRRIARGRRSIGGLVAGNAPTLLLTTTGRRSGRARTVPLLFNDEPAGTILLIAANGAADWDPDWVHNRRADPRALIERNGQRIAVQAELLEGEAHDAAWPAAVDAFAGLANGQRAARRRIPLIRLTTS